MRPRLRGLILWPVCLAVFGLRGSTGHLDIGISMPGIDPFCECGTLPRLHRGAVQEPANLSRGRGPASLGTPSHCRPKTSSRLVKRAVAEKEALSQTRIPHRLS